MENTPQDIVRKAFQQVLVATLSLAGSAIVFLTGGFKGIAAFLMAVMIVCDIRAVMYYRDLALMRRIQQAGLLRADFPVAPAREQ